MMDAIDERTFRYARNLVARLPEPNRQTAERYLVLKKNAGLAAGTISNQAHAIYNLGEQLGSTLFSEVDQDDLIALVERLRRVVTDNTVAQRCVLLRAFLKYVLDVETLPSALRLALTVKAPRPGSTKKPVTEEEFQALLEANEKTTPPLNRLRCAAILWTLRDSGMRASEVLALNVGSVELTKDGGAFLQIPADAPRLKTGPRRPYVVECVPALKAWLAVHPRPDEVAAPLFPGARPGPNCRRATYHALLQQMRNLSEQAGLRMITPHLFRHAKATQMARNRWSPNLATKQMGWAPGSKMWGHYTHLIDEDLVEQVRRHARIDGTSSGPRLREKRCPMCAEVIHVAARKCKHCREIIGRPSDACQGTQNDASGRAREWDWLFLNRGTHRRS